jgi:hypothetical protein
VPRKRIPFPRDRLLHGENRKRTIKVVLEVYEHVVKLFIGGQDYVQTRAAFSNPVFVVLLFLAPALLLKLLASKLFIAMCEVTLSPLRAGLTFVVRVAHRCLVLEVVAARFISDDLWEDR